MLIQPHVSEKSYALGQSQRTYIFKVPKDSNKITIKKAVEVQYGVHVTNVNISVAKGKAKKTGVKNKQPRIGKRSDVKKAFVSLKEGESITVFETEGEKA